MEKKQTNFFLITGSRYPGIHGRSNTKQPVLLLNLTLPRSKLVLPLNQTIPRSELYNVLACPTTMEYYSANQLQEINYTLNLQEVHNNMEKQSLLDEKQTLLDDIDDRQKTYNSENRRLAKQVERQKKHIKCLENCISNLKKSKLKNDNGLLRDNSIILHIQKKQQQETIQDLSTNERSDAKHVSSKEEFRNEIARLTELVNQQAKTRLKNFAYTRRVKQYHLHFLPATPTTTASTTPKKEPAPYTIPATATATATPKQHVRKSEPLRFSTPISSVTQTPPTLLTNIEQRFKMTSPITTKMSPILTSKKEPAPTTPTTPTPTQHVRKREPSRFSTPIPIVTQTPPTLLSSHLTTNIEQRKKMTSPITIKDEMTKATLNEWKEVKSRKRKDSSLNPLTSIWSVTRKSDEWEEVKSKQTRKKEKHTEENYELYMDQEEIHPEKTVGNKICFAFVAGTCSLNSSSCTLIHPTETICAEIRRGLSTKECQFGSECYNRNCLHKHPKHDNKGNKTSKSNLYFSLKSHT